MKIEHIALYVNDLEGAKEFFINYFDAKAGDMYHNKRTNFKSYFLSFEDGARIEIMSRPDTNDIEKILTRTGFAHIAFSVGSKEKVDKLTARLKEDCFEVIRGPRVTGDGYYESCILAFEGNQIEITI
ncbi:MAG: glyoxalase [Lachnospiraceae bacterium]|nr:glyoxalase [Lachnospiraceae bacterium]